MWLKALDVQYMLRNIRPVSKPTRHVLDEREMYPHIFPNYRPHPVPSITVGSIILWVLLKLAVLVPLVWFVVEQYGWHHYWLVAIALLWLTVVYPAFTQYYEFLAQTQILESSTLCAQCQHFEPTGHLCKLLDEHISVQHIPCNGECWEAKQSDYRSDDDTLQ